jgi:peptidyl-prolyl cis-trans isomerase C
MKEKKVLANSLISRYFLFTAILAVTLCAALHDQNAAAQEKVLAKIGDQTVTEKDLNETVASFPDKFYETPEGQSKALDYLINIHVMAAEAQKQGLDKEPDVQRLLTYTTKEMLARVYLDKLTKNLPNPTDADAKTYYDKNKAQFVIPESVLLRHILVKSEKEAKEAIDRLKKGEKFPDLAAQISMCPSRAKGGSLDWMPKGTLVKEIEDEAFGMKNGQMTGPIKSRFGYHVLLLEDKRPPQETSFDQVKDSIIERLKFEAQQEQYEKIAGDLRKKMNVQVAQPAAEKATVTPAVPAGPTGSPKK